MEKFVINDSFTVGIHSSRPESVSVLNCPDSQQREQDKGVNRLLYSTGQEMRCLIFDEGLTSVNHFTFAKSQKQHHTGCVACICSNARHVLSCDFDGEIILWDMNSRELLDVLDMSSNDFYSQSGLEYLQDADLKSRHISISDDSQFAAVALEGVFTLVMIRIQNGCRLCYLTSMRTCVEYVQFISSPSGYSYSRRQYELLCIRRNLPAVMAKGLNSSKDLDLFGYSVDFRTVDGDTLKLESEIVLSIQQKIGYFECNKGYCVLLHRASKKVSVVCMANRVLLGTISWINLGNCSPVLCNTYMRLMVYPGVLMSINIRDIFIADRCEFEVELPTKQEIRSKNAKNGFINWTEYEKSGVSFMSVSKDVGDLYVAIIQIAPEFVIVFTQYEIVVSKIEGRQSSAGDFSGQIVVSNLERQNLEGSSSLVNIDKSSVMKCNDNVHGMYSVEESVRSLTWHPHYEEVLFMGLFNSTLVFVDVQSDHCVPVLIDDISSGAITCLKWSLLFFPNDKNPAKRLLSNSVYNDINSSKSGQVIQTAAILLAGTTSGHVTLYRHDFCYNRRDLMTKLEVTGNHIKSAEFCASFTKLTTFLAHHPIESNDSFGSLGHFAEVWSCAWTPIGDEGLSILPNHFLTCSEDQQVRVWSLNWEVEAAKRWSESGDGGSDVDDGERRNRSEDVVHSIDAEDEEKPVSCPVYVLTGHRYAVTCLDWKLLNESVTERFKGNRCLKSSDGTLITFTSFMASCSDDRSIRIYKVTESFHQKASNYEESVQQAKKPNDVSESLKTLKVDVVNVVKADIDFELVILLSTAFLRDWHTLTYTCLQSDGSHLAVVTQNGYLLVFCLSEADVICDSGSEDTWEFVDRPKSIVFCKKVANGSLEGLSWSQNSLCMSSADCCLNVKNMEFN
ncbi:uncharacterized protein LOC142341647 isoform X2 [Convolutriloba macropyga]|uniref:uncharacterized protein LOC142341647 isoform X2 n=1 Tax=Convolutriloba macropyga TaxID=536237 RepID=UPI003F526DDC